MCVPGDRDAEVSSEYGETYSNTYSEEWSSFTEESFTIGWSDKQEGLALWQFVFVSRDSCGSDSSIKTQT